MTEPTRRNTKFTATDVVPSPVAPIRPGRNAVWCGSLQLAWNQLAETLGVPDVVIPGAESICEPLNASAFSEKDLPERCCYRAAGFGIARRIRQELTSRFPDVSVEMLPGDMDPDHLMVFAYLNVVANFDPVFIENPQPLEFRDDAQLRTKVASFGLPKEAASKNSNCRRRVSVLFTEDSGDFAVDLCQDSPVEVIVACLTPETSLEETIASVEAMAEAFRARPGYEYERILHSTDRLLVPKMHWSLAHHFPEIAGRMVRLRDGSETAIESISQQIRFSLDEQGARVESTGSLSVRRGRTSRPKEPRALIANRPFLFMMRKRGSNLPFLALWVNHPELLIPQEEASYKIPTIDDLLARVRDQQVQDRRRTT